MTTLTTAQLIPSEPEPDPPAAAALTPSEERLIRFFRRLAPLPGIGPNDPVDSIGLIKEEVALILAVREHLPGWEYDRSYLPGSARRAVVAPIAA